MTLLVHLSCYLITKTKQGPFKVALDDRYANKFVSLHSTAIYPKLSHKLLYRPMTDEMKCPINIPFTMRIPLQLLWCWRNICTNNITNDILYIIIWLYWFIDLDLTFSSLLSRSIDAKSCSNFTVTRGLSVQSFRLALHTSNRSVEPNLILIFFTFVIWLQVMSHMQWGPPSSYFNLWANLLCISHKHILVHLSCHSITKTKQGPFREGSGHGRLGVASAPMRPSWGGVARRGRPGGPHRGAVVEVRCWRTRYEKETMNQYVV